MAGLIEALAVAGAVAWIWAAWRVVEHTRASMTSLRAIERSNAEARQELFALMQRIFRDAANRQAKREGNDG